MPVNMFNLLFPKTVMGELANYKNKNKSDYTHIIFYAFLN